MAHSSPPSPEAAEAEVAELWAAYRDAHDRGALAEEVEVLRKRVSVARARMRKQGGLNVAVQRLQDLATYVKRLAPAAMEPPTRRPTPEELDRAVTALEREVDRGGAASGLLPRVQRVLQLIEDERRLDPDEADEDHDRFVGMEERLWDLRERLGRDAQAQSGE